MSAGTLPENSFGLAEPGTASDRFFWLLCGICAIVVLPNIWLFSVDDMFIINTPDPLRALALNQAANGRYGFAAASAALRFLGAGRIDLEVTGLATTIVGLTSLFLQTVRFSQSRFRRLDLTFAFATFVTFGFMMDVYQFRNQSIQIGIASLAAAGTLYFARTRSGAWKRVAISSFLGWIGLGFYQIYPYLLACSMTSAAIMQVSNTQQDGLYRRAVNSRRYFELALSGMLAIAAYGITAKACKLVGIAGFEMYPQRPFGLRFVSQNIESYFSTATQVLNPASRAYGHFLSHATLISLVIAVSVLVTRGSAVGSAVDCVHASESNEHFTASMVAIATEPEFNCNGCFVGASFLLRSFRSLDFFCSRCTNWNGTGDFFTSCDLH